MSRLRWQENAPREQIAFVPRDLMNDEERSMVTENEEKRRPLAWPVSFEKRF